MVTDEQSPKGTYINQELKPISPYVMEKYGKNFGLSEDTIDKMIKMYFTEQAYREWKERDDR